MKLKLLFVSMFVIGALGIVYSPAQAAGIMCTNLSYNLSYGSRDAGTNGEVTVLQNYLNLKGYLSVTPTGYFGSMTRAAAQSFQRDNGIITTGYVGPITRARLQSLTCGNPPPVQQVSVFSLNPTWGPIGTVVTVVGQGFTSDSLVHFGPGAMGNITFIDSRTLQFTVPSSIGPYCKPYTPCPMYMARITTPGNYNVSISNDSGTSNEVNFYVTDTSNTNVFSISGLDAPSTLTYNNMGTWTVRVNNPGLSALHYSVVWGDEMMMTNSASIAAPTQTNTQSSATFTHAYSRTGTYTPSFTVTDDNGHSANTSASVVVTPIY